MTQKVAAHKMLQRQKTNPEEFEHLVSSVLTPIKILGENQKLWQVDYKIYALKSFILVVIIALFNLLCRGAVKNSWKSQVAIANSD